MSTATPAPPVKPPSVAVSMDEFSDKLSPMLVKELRQGLRAKTFVVLFLALQALLAVVLLSAIGASSDGSAGGAVSRVIFFFFSLAALVAQPLRGVGALHQEIKGDSIDLMLLTRLGAWRIVLGKWVAIVSQTGLLLVAIVPYLILRYFFGSMDLFAELLLFLLVFLLSAALTAVTVGLSAVPSILVRGLLPLGAAIYLGGGIFAMSFDGWRGIQPLVEFCSLQVQGSGWALLTGLLVTTYLAWMSLALGASMIAPLAENHSTPRRLVALGTTLIFAAIAYFAELEVGVVCAMLLLIAVPAVVTALNEPQVLLPPICRPFLRFGGLGRLAGRFLYPGWPTGVLFSGLMMLAVCAVFYLSPDVRGHVSGHEVPLLTVAIFMGFGSLMLAALIVRAFARKMNGTLGFFLLFVVLLIFAAIAVAMIASETRMEYDHWQWWLVWIPPVQMNLTDLVRTEHFSAGGHLSAAFPNYGPVIQTSMVVAGCYFGLMILLALVHFRSIREVEDAAANPGTPES